jgi:hypothetical protein
MLSGQTREDVLAQLTGDLPGQLGDQRLRALQAELSGDCRSRPGRGGQDYWVGRMTRVSVTIAVTRSAGVTSKA